MVLCLLVAPAIELLEKPPNLFVDIRYALGLGLFSRLFPIHGFPHITSSSILPSSRAVYLYVHHATQLGLGFLNETRAVVSSPRLADLG